MEFTHPIDPVLAGFNWRRIELNDLTADEQPVMMVWHLPGGVARSYPHTITPIVFSAFLRKQGELAVARINPPPSPPFDVLAQEGADGFNPTSLALTPCNCPANAAGQRPWVPLPLTLQWATSMKSRSRRHYLFEHSKRLLKDTSWQCRDIQRLM